MRTPLIVLTCLLLVGCASRTQVIQQHFADDKFIHITRIHELDKVTDIDNYVFYYNKGDTIPLKIQLQSEILEIAEDQVNIVLKKKLFLRCDTSTLPLASDKELLYSLTAEKMAAMDADELKKLLKNIKFYLSQDGNTWALLTDIRALKEVFEIGQGQLNLGMAMNKDEGIWFMISLIMHSTAGPST